MVQAATEEVKKEITVIDLSCLEEEGTPFRPVMYLKRIEDMKRYEEVEDCFILDFDPNESVDLSKLAVSAKADDDEVSIIAETGKVACRDYPHSRHLCVKFPFHTTSHHIHCHLCYCYVCDSLAPCKKWTEPEKAHCDASENDSTWFLMRRLKKEQENQLQIRKSPPRPCLGAAFGSSGPVCPSQAEQGDRAICSNLAVCQSQAEQGVVCQSRAEQGLAERGALSQGEARPVEAVCPSPVDEGGQQICSRLGELGAVCQPEAQEQGGRSICIRLCKQSAISQGEARRDRTVCPNRAEQDGRTICNRIGGQSRREDARSDKSGRDAVRRPSRQVLGSTRNSYLTSQKTRRGAEEEDSSDVTQTSMARTRRRDEDSRRKTPIRPTWKL